MVLSTTETRTFEKGKTVIRQGEIATAAYMIKSGLVRVYHQEEDGQTEIASLGPGEIFGETAIIRHKHHTLTVEALTDIEAYIITPQTIENKIKKLDPLMRSLMLMSFDRMSKANEALIKCKCSREAIHSVFKG